MISIDKLQDFSKKCMHKFSVSASGRQFNDIPEICSSLAILWDKAQLFGETENMLLFSIVNVFLELWTMRFCTFLESGRLLSENHRLIIDYLNYPFPSPWNTGLRSSHGRWLGIGAYTLHITWALFFYALRCKKHIELLPADVAGRRRGAASGGRSVWAAPAAPQTDCRNTERWEINKQYPQQTRHRE